MSRTNIELDDKLVKQGLKLTKLKTKKDLVNYALGELVQREKKRKILELEGKVNFYPGYDYKALRKNRFEDNS